MAASTQFAYHDVMSVAIDTKPIQTCMAYNAKPIVGELATVQKDSEVITRIIHKLTI